MVEKDSEEIFLTLLQRVQRQYAADTPNSTSDSSSTTNRPPDEAAAALGRQLAISYQSMVEQKRKFMNKSDTDGGDSEVTLTDPVPKGTQEKALAGLSNRHVNPSVCRSFFSTLIESYSESKNFSMEWLPAWILHCEEQVQSILDMEDDSTSAHQALEPLTTTIQAFASYKNIHMAALIKELSEDQAEGIAMVNETGDIASQSQQITSLHQRLQTSIARTSLARELTRVAFSNIVPDKESTSTTHEQSSLKVKYLLSPLLAAGFLSLSTPISESALLVDAIWRECWSELSNVGDIPEEDDASTHFRAVFAAYFDLLQWFSKSLEYFIWSINCRTSIEQRTSCKELGFRWCIQLLELALYLSQTAIESEDSFDPSDLKSPMKLLSSWTLEMLSGSLIRIFAICPSYRISMEPALTLLHDIVERLGPQHIVIDPTSAIRISSLALSDPIKDDVRAIINLLSAFGQPTGPSAYATRGMLKMIASTFLRDDTCEVDCQDLLQSLQNQISSANAKPESRASWTATNAIQFIGASTVEASEFVAFISSNDVFSTSNLTAYQQTAALLLGVGLLEDAKTRDSAYLYLKNMLGRYPHLGISLLSIMVNSINIACMKGDSETMMRQLQFLCDAMSVDSQCAKEIWNLIGVDMMKPSSPPTVRAAIIRLFPRLCATNKRLYKRIIEVIGRNLSPNEHTEVRLAVAVTLAELAREDRIRDVTDVVGWIQGFIMDNGWVQGTKYTSSDQDSPGKAAMAHYAILSLHYLVVAQELEYPLVLVVLNKRLCNVHNVEDILRLPPLVIESLVLLLGDGECDDTSDDDDGPAPVGVSAHVSRSVEALVMLANSDELELKNSRNGTFANESIVRIRHNIHISLSRYSTNALGIDEDGIRAVIGQSEENTKTLPSSGNRYVALQKIVRDGIDMDVPEILPVLEDLSDPDNLVTETLKDTKGAVSLASKILLLEEEVLGSSLWQKRGKVPKIGKQKTSKQIIETPEASRVEALPSPASVQQAYNESRSSASSLAALLCFEGKPISLLSDLASDITNESTDPFILMFTVQGWINVARQVLLEPSSHQSYSGLEQIASEVREWPLENPDNMYLALSSFCICCLDTSSLDGSENMATVKSICNEVLNAYMGHEFENADLGKLALAMVGMCSVWTHSMQNVEKIVATLEKSVSGYGGASSFGAYYGLAMIAQALPSLCLDDSEQAEEHNAAKQIISRILGFLVSEIVTCINGKHAILGKLVKCIKDGAMKSEVIDALVSLRKKTLTISGFKGESAKCIFMAFGLCLPSLCSVNEELLLGTFCLLEGIQWGSGKGLAVPSALKSCLKSGIFTKSEMDKIYGKYAKALEDEMSKSSDGAALVDIFYAVTATMRKAIPDTIRLFLVGNQALFDEDERSLSIVTAVVSLCSCPCLGCGTSSISNQPTLLSAATKDDIKGVIGLISGGASGHDEDKYNQVSIVLIGFMATLRLQGLGIADADRPATKNPSKPQPGAVTQNQSATALPTALVGTTLEIILNSLSQKCSPTQIVSGTANKAIARLLGTLEKSSLPGHFAAFLEQVLRGDNEIKEACVRLLSAQLEGRPRAVFDGREFSELALQVSTTPVSALRAMFGLGDAATIFLEAIADIIPRLPSGSIEEAVEQLWRFCISQVNQNPSWTSTFLSSFASLLKINTKRSSSISPKIATFLRQFVSKTIFAGIRDAGTLEINRSTEAGGQSIYDLFITCLTEIPVTMLTESEFFSLKELDGFSGESLRYRCIMSLVHRGYFSTSSRASSEVTSSVAWLSRQLISSEEEIFSSALLRVACATAEATVNERKEKKRDILMSVLDNFLMLEASASSVGLQLLGLLVSVWCNGKGFDGDLSLGCLCVPGIKQWQALSPSTLQHTVQLMVSDLPYNLSRYCRQEKILPVVFNRLWRVYNKWSERGSEQESLDCVGKALSCCRSMGSGEQEFASMTTKKLL